MAPLLKGADVIIPLAALVGAPLCDRDPSAATDDQPRRHPDHAQAAEPRSSAS